MEKPLTTKPVLLSLGYLPPVDWFVAFATHDVVIEQHEHYSKGSFRNRCQIIASGGAQRLTVPLRKGKNEQQPIKEVRIAYDEPWQIRHWRSICTTYGNSPFYEHYIDSFRPFYFEKKYDLLWNWNLDLLKLALKLLKLEKAFSFTESYEQVPQTAFDLRGDWENNPIQILDNQPYKYPQVFEDRLGFIPNASILDLIFCVGRIGIM